MSVSRIPDESPFADRAALEQWARENLSQLRNNDDQVTYVNVTTDSVADGAYTQLYWTGEHRPDEYTASWERLFALDDQSLIRSVGASPPNPRLRELGLESAGATVFDNLSNQILGDKVNVQFSKLISDDYTRVSLLGPTSVGEYQWLPALSILRISPAHGVAGTSLQLMATRVPGDYIKIYDNDDNFLEARITSSSSGINFVFYNVHVINQAGSFINNL